MKRLLEATRSEGTGLVTDDPNKKPKKGFVRSEWVSASDIKNYIMEDPMLDVLHYRPHRSGTDTFFHPSPDTFIEHLMKRGNKYEAELIKILFRRFHGDIVDIGGNGYSSHDSDKVEETKQAIKKKVPIIYSGVLWNDHNKTFGVPDLLIRSDMLAKMFEEPPPMEYHKEPYYCVVDIKSSMMPLTADGIYLRKEGLYPAYKAQLYIYNEALRLLQPFTPNKAYIWGKGWSYTSNSAPQKDDKPFSFKRLGTIDYSGKKKKTKTKSKKKGKSKPRDDFDKAVPELVYRAIDWILEMRKNCVEWKRLLKEVLDLKKGDPIPRLPRWELYPNMKNPYDQPHSQDKQRIAENLKEITLVWQCGFEKRQLAHQKDVYRYDDDRCTPELLGVNGVYTRHVLDSLLEINKSRCKEVVMPRIIKDDREGWNEPERVEFFVDFETISDVMFDGFDRKFTTIFMIGVGYENPETRAWVYRSFIAEKVDDRDAEKKVLFSFRNYVRSVCEVYGVSEPLLFHWSHCETSHWGDAVDRHVSLIDDEEGEFSMQPRWFDLLLTFKPKKPDTGHASEEKRVIKERVNPIVVKGALGFGVKAIGNALHSLGLIKKVWPRTGIMDGNSAMVEAAKCYTLSEETGAPVTSFGAMQNIVTYNEMDCYVMYEILKYLRENHLPLALPPHRNENPPPAVPEPIVTGSAENPILIDDDEETEVFEEEESEEVEILEEESV